MTVKIKSANGFPQAWYAGLIGHELQVEPGYTQFGEMYKLLDQGKYIHPDDCEEITPVQSETWLNVLQALKTERNFQDAAVADPSNPVMIDLQMGSTLAAIQLNLNKALQSWYSDAAPYPQTMNMLRKIGALCIQAGEKWGMPPRIIETQTNG